MTSAILAGWCAIAALALFKGASPQLISLVPMAVAVGLSSGTALFPASAFLLALSLLAPEAIPWAVLAGSVLFCVLGRGTALRVSGFVMAACILWFVPVRSSVPLLLLCAAGVVFSNRQVLVYLAAAAAFLASALFAGIPQKAVVKQRIALARIDDQQIIYETEHLYTDSKEVLFPAPLSGEWIMWLAVDPGGVRDTLPMIALCLGEEMTFLPSGPDTLCFTFHPGDTLSVMLMRDYMPFLHPVVHVSAGGERL